MDEPPPDKSQPSASELPAAPADITTVEQARKFLQDNAVQLAGREQKIEFLKGKGLLQAQIEALLDGDGEGEGAHDVKQSTTRGHEQPEHNALSTTTSSSPAQSGSDPDPDPESSVDRAPILTYPEFLARPARPPPLITPAGVVTALYAFTGLSTAIYGAGRFMLAPMVAALADARIELHATAAQNLGRLVEKLEGVVSEIPTPAAARPARRDDDDASSCGDPAELFHRDVGVQASLPANFTVSAGLGSPLPARQDVCGDQTRTVGRLAASAKSLADGLKQQSSCCADARAALDALSADVGQVKLQGESDFLLGYMNYGNGSSTRSEPDDEVRRAKENIRRVKGVLLSARSFPASVRS